MKKYNIFLLIVGIFFFLQNSLYPQLPFDEKPKEEVVRWKVSVVPKKDSYKVGDIITLKLIANIKKGYHVFSAIPPAKGGYRPAEFFLDEGSKGLELVGKLSEEGKMFSEYNSIMEDTLRFYKNTVTFKQKIKITGVKAFLDGYLTYQYCTDDEGQCFFPTKEVRFPIPVKLVNIPEKGTTTPAKDEDTVKKKEIYSTSEISVPTETVDKTGSKELPDFNTKGEGKHSLWLTFLFAFVAGIFAIFTPCVFPMIPMTISFFLKQGTGREEETKKGFLGKLSSKGTRQALFYAVSILFIFTILGLTLTLIFGKTFLYEIASNPWVNLFFFIVLFLFGLSFLGWFELKLPSSWATAIDRQSEKGGYLGIFFMALALVIVSFSCTGPLVGTVLIETAGGHYLEPFVGMLGFAVAFALPFGILAFFPSLIQKWQQSRKGWLLTFERSLGFLELGFSFKFLSNSDLVWHTGILDREIFLAVWVGIAILWALYLLGLLRFENEPPVEGISVPRMLVSWIVIAFVFYLLPGFWGAPLKLISGYLPPLNEDMGVILLENQRVSLGTFSANTKNEICNLNRKYADVLSKDTPPGFCAFYDLDEAIEYSKKVKKPILIDFTGHTCNNCRQVENAVWSNPKVKEKMNKDFVLVSLFVDERFPLDKKIITSDGRKLRTVGDKWLFLQDSLFGTQAQPYYVIVDDNLRLLTKPKSYDLNIDNYLKFLSEGLENYKKYRK